MRKGELYKIRPIKDLRDMLTQSVSLFGDCAAFRKKESDGQINLITFKEFSADVSALGTALLKLGLSDKKIAVISENRHEWCVTYLSVVNGVGTIVPIDRELPVTDWQNLLTQSEASAVIFSEKCLDAVKSMLGKIPSIQFWICMDQIDDENFLSYSDLLDNGRKALEAGSIDYQKTEINPDSPLILLFTSGTTGFSKGVMLSHRNICSVITSVSATVCVKPTDSVLSILPLHHTYECTLGFLTIVYNGASIAFCEGLKHISKNLKEYEPTFLITVPLLLENVYKKVWSQAEKQKGMKQKLIIGQLISNFLYTVLGIDIRRKLFKQIHDNVGGHLQTFITGAAAIDPKVSRGFRRWGFSVLQGYGLTECSPLVTGNRDSYYRDGSAGLAIPGVEIKINEPDRKGIGEILVSGNNVMLGYFNDPEETNKVLVNGWFHTGDVGRIDKKGFLYITGRCKNVIVTKNGKNIFPEELESYIIDSPYVAECVVYGVLDESSGETRIMAKIFPDLEAVAEKLKNAVININTEDILNLLQEVIKNVNRKIPLYKHIRDIIIRDNEFEKTTTKKIRRYTQQMQNHNNLNNGSF